MDESSIKNSFRAVKGDILRIEGELMNIKQQQAEIIAKLEKLSQSKKKAKKK